MCIRDRLYGARHVGLRAGVPIETPALTVNRLCGSGMQAIVSAAQMIQTDDAKIVLAGGMEAMSQAPFSIRGRDGFTPVSYTHLGHRTIGGPCRQYHAGEWNEALHCRERRLSRLSHPCFAPARGD